jgi:integrase
MQQAKRLTEQAIKRLVSDSSYEQKDKSLKDGGCQHLYIRARASGTAQFFVSRKIDGRKINCFFGKHPEFSIAKSRELTPVISRLIGEGFSNAVINKAIHPEINSTELETAIIGSSHLKHQPKTPTLSEAIEVWHHNNYTLSDKSSRTKPMPPLQRYIVPALGQRPLDKITRQEIREVLTPMWSRDGQRGGNKPAGYETAKKLRNYLGSIFDFFIDEEIIDRNPVPAMKSFPKRQPKVTHHKELDWREAPAFYKWLQENNRISLEVKTGIMMCLLLGVRSKEVMFLKWEYIDFDKGMFNAPAKALFPNGRYENYTKTGVPHVQMLSRQMMELLLNVKTITGDKEYALNLKGKPMSDGTMRGNTKKYEPQPFVPHGLRATITNYLTNEDCPKTISDHILSHTPSTADAPYYREGLKQSQKWLQRWADYVTGEVI